MNKDDKIYIAGHNGMVGSAIVRLLKEKGFKNLCLKKSKDLDLKNSSLVKEFFDLEKPDIVIMAAAKVGGILANINSPAEFLYENLAMQNNIIHQSYLHKVKKFCFLGSSCIYPKECEQPIKEEYLMSGLLETTNEGYALAKIAGLKMIEYYNKQYKFPGISLMPCNLYGTNDSFDPLHSHVLTALIKKFDDALENGAEYVDIWGTGNARREFMHVDDAAAAVVFMMENYEKTMFINIGCGKDISIKELAGIIAEKIGYTGEIRWDRSKPDGMLRKCLDVSKMKKIGFFPKISLNEGIDKTIIEYRTLKCSGELE